MKKYYYVSYEVRYRTALGSVIGGIVIDTDPLDWVISINATDIERQYIIISWNEITKEQCEKHKDEY